MIKEDNVECCGSCDYSWGNFKNLNTDELKLVCKNRYQANYTAGEIIFKQGSPISDAVFLLSGYAKIHVEGFDGKRILLSIAQQSTLIAGPGAYLDNKHNYTLTALTNVKACFIKMDILKHLVLTNSKFAEGFLVDISQKSVVTFHKLISHSQKKMPGRLAEALLYLANVVHKSDEFTLLLSRQELGELSGMAKESVVRLLRDFSDAHFVETNEHQIKLLNKVALEDVSSKG